MAKCSDCLWVERRAADDESDAQAFCVKTGSALTRRELLREPCADFRPLETTRCWPAQGARADSPPPAPPPLLQPPDPDGFRRFLRDEKSFAARPKLMSERQAVRRFIKKRDYVGFELYGT